MTLFKHQKFIQLIIVLLFLCFPARDNCFALGEKQIIVVLRYDDFSARSATELEKKLIDTFRIHKISCTFAVTPYVFDKDYLYVGKQDFIALTPQKAEILREAINTDTVEVALHGYSHQTIRKKGEGRATEFSGLDYDEQEFKIMNGKLFLEWMLQTKITIFVPPFNSYDQNTLRVLENHDFRCISANRFGIADNHSKLKYLPITCELYQVKDAIASARIVPDVQPVIGVMFHEYDFKEVDNKRGRLSYQDFLQIINWLAAQKDVQVMNVGRATSIINDLSLRRYIDNRTYCSAFTLIPEFVSKPMGVFLASDTAVKNKNKLWAQVTIFMIVVLCASGSIAIWIGRVELFRSVILYFGAIASGSVFLTLGVLYYTGLKALGYRGAIIMAVLFGSCMGLSMSCIKLRKKGKYSPHDTNTEEDRSSLPG